MTINIFVLKGDLNGKIVVVRFFFVGYIIVAFPQPVIWREGLTLGANLSPGMDSFSQGSQRQMLL